MLKRFFHFIWLLSIAVLFLVAVTLTAARLWVPSLAEYRHDVEQAASEALGREVTVGRMEATWRGLYPVLKLKDVRVAASDAALQPFPAEEIWVRLDVVSSLRQRQVQIAGIDIIGVDLVLVRDAQGEIYLQQFRDDDSGSDESPDRRGGIAGLARMSRLSVHDASLTVRDELTGAPPRRFSAVMLTLINEGDQHRLTGHAYLPADAGYRLEIDALFTGAAANFRVWQGRAYIKGQNLSLTSMAEYWLPQKSVQGIAELRLWVDVDAARIVAMAGELDVRDAHIGRETDGQLQAFSVDSLGVQLGWRETGDRWQGALRLLSASQAERQWQPFELSLSGETSGDLEQLRISTRQLILDDLWQLLPAIPGLSPEQFARLAALKPSGQLGELVVTLQRTDDTIHLSSFNASFDELSIEEAGAYRLVAGLDGKITGSGDSGTLMLDSRDVYTTDTRIFREILLIDELQGDIHWQRTSDSYRVSSDRLAVVNPDMQLLAKFALTLPAGDEGTQLDLDIDVASLDIGRASHYLPAKIMSPTGVAWLDRSLVRGQVRDGSVQVHGRLDQLPFDHGEGQLEIRLPAYGVTLDFNKDWTPIRQLDAQINFTGRQMDITNEHRGKIRSASVSNVHAQIRDLAKPVLTLVGDVQGQLPVMLAELGSSPLGEKFGGFVDRTITTGAGGLQLDLRIPLTGKDREMTTNGRIQLKGNTLAVRETDISLKGIKGELTFDSDSIKGDGLQATLFGRQAAVRVWGEPGKPDTHIHLSGKLALFDVVLGEQDPLRKAVTGDSDWQVQLTLRGTPARGAAANIGLRISSTLAGTAIKLPPPLGKTGASQRPLSIVVDNLQHDNKQLTLNYGSELKGRLQLVGATDNLRLKRGVITLGGAEAPVSDTPGLLINGRLERLHVTEWLPWLESGQHGPTMPIRFDLDVDELEVLGFYLDELQLAAASSGRVWNITASGPSTRGDIELTQSADGLEKVVMNMQRLALKKPDTPPTADRSSFTPADMPELLVTIKELVFNDTSFGQLDLKTAVVPGNKLVVERLALSSEWLSMRLTGEWRVTGTRHQSQVDLEVTEGRMDRLLDVLGYQKVIKDGELFGSMQASWPAPLWGFLPEIVDGELNVKIKDGQLLEIEPGATGRALGLLSLGMLPKRLTLDFSDLFEEGFGFERITGNFVLDSGNAYTNDLLIDGPAAKIEISGRVGLADKDYDELVTVTPYLSSSLPLAGALVGGPVVGAAVIVVDKLLGDKLGLNELARKQYSVTGPWDGPVATRINTATKPDTEVDDYFDEDF